MAYVTPTIDDLKGLWPVFASIPDATLTAWLSRAINRVGTQWPEDVRADAQLYLAAHLLATQGAGDASGTIATNGAVKRDKVGDTETEFAGFSNSGRAGIYGSTAYGLEYFRLLQIYFGGPVVV